jgi:hypothetical protein
MKKKYKNRAEQQDAYRERVKDRQRVEAEIADELAAMKRLNLCSFGEVAFETPARTWLEEVQTHRSWLRAFRDIGMEEPDVLPGESLRDLARRTWQALLRSEKFGLGVTTDGGGKWVDTPNGKQWVRGFGVWYPCFQPSKQHFQIPFDSSRYPGGPLGEGIRDAAQEGWFEAHWIAPSDCSGDEPIDIENLPSLPPMPVTSRPEPKQVKPPVSKPIESAPDPGLRLFDEMLAPARFGTFGVTTGLSTS